ncbi:MAG: saccharopine dehydrogenase NADP-binding domain-containing protein [Parasphingorhabdus sp.]
MTKVLVLGAGEVGAAAVDYTARLENVTSVTAADLNKERATAVASLFEKAKPLGLDIKNSPALVQTMRQHDAVLNTVGPFFRFATPVFEAALVAGITYLDVADDWEPTLELLALDGQAKARGVTAIVGMGASPGLANLLARAAMEDRPDANELYTAWRADDVGTGYSAAKEHWLHQCTGAIRVLRGGKMVDEPPLRSIPIHYPSLGELELVSVGHPEAVTLPLRYGRLQDCVNAMVLPPKLLSLLRTHLAEDPSDLRESATSFNARYDAMGPDNLSVFEKLEGLFAVARYAEGSSVVTLLTYPDGLGPVTSAPLAAALDLVLAGKGPEPGVWTPEDAFAPDDFFSHFAKLIGAKMPITRTTRL